MSTKPKTEPGAEESLLVEPGFGQEINTERDEQQELEKQQDLDDIAYDENERKPVPNDDEQELEVEAEYAEQEAGHAPHEADEDELRHNSDREPEEDNLNQVNEDEELSEVDEDAGQDYEDEEEQIFGLSRHKKSSGVTDDQPSVSKGKKRAQKSYNDEPQQRDEVYTIDETSNPVRQRELIEKKIEAALKASKPTRRKKVGDIDLEQMQDAQIQSLKNLMQEVAYEDAKCIDERSGVALNKLKLLPKVKEVLLRKNLADSVLDNNLLESVRVWLEPLPDGSLPAYEIQKVMFSSLLDLPIKTIHLRESGLGKVILFYQKSKRVEPGLKRIADKLVGNWTRPILNLSDNYHDKYVQEEQFDILKLIEARKRKTSNIALEKTLYEETAARRKRAAAPQARATAYKIAPKVNLDGKHMNDRARMAAAGIGAALNRDDQYKRLNSKMQNRGKRVGAKKAGVSIEGRNLHM